MKTLRIETGALVPPFDEPPSKACFAGTTVGDAIAHALERRGLELVTLAADEAPPTLDEGCLVMGDVVYASDKCLGDFLALVFGSDVVERLCLARTPSSDYTRPVSSLTIEKLDSTGPGARPAGAKGPEADATERVAYDVFWVPAGKMPEGTGVALLEALRHVARARVVKKREIGITIRLPLLGDSDAANMVFPVTSTVAAHVEHRVHVLWLNHLAFGIRWMEIARAHKGWCTWRMLAAGWPRPNNILRSFVRKGRGVKIHPTAHVEASILGDGVEIGPRATVRNSILGDGVCVADHSAVIACTLGPRAYVAPKTFFVWSVAYEDAVINNFKMQMSVLGRGAAPSTWAGFIDARFEGHVKVMKDGKPVSTERSFLGSAVGHGAFVGAKVLIQAGREIPGGTVIAMRPDEPIREIPRNLKPGTPVVRDAGTLVPVEELLSRG